MKIKTEIRRNIRALSPVLSVLLMIAITVVASIVAYAWIAGYLNFTTARSGKALQIQSAAIDPNTNMLFVYVQNVGQGIVKIGSDSVYVKDKPQSVFSINGDSPPSFPFTISEGQTVTIIVDYLATPNEQTKIKITTIDGSYSESLLTLLAVTAGQKRVNVVICVDTEMGGGHDPYLDPSNPKNSDPNPELDMSAYSVTIPSTVAAIFDDDFRNSHTDSFGDTFKMTWFAESDLLFSQGEYVWGDQSDAGVSGYTGIYDILRANWGTQIDVYGDTFEYHHHFIVFENGRWQSYWEDLNQNYQYQMDALDHMIIDRNFYPSVWRTGWNVMSSGLSNWLDNWMPFEYTSSGGNWVPFHPDGAVHWAETTPGFEISQDEVNAAFMKAHQDGSAIVSIYCHERDPMSDIIDSLQTKLENAKSAYPDVSFQYVSAKNAMQNALGYSDRTGPNLTLTENDGTYTIQSNEPLWGNHPYVALKYADNTYVHVEATPIAGNTWSVTPLTGVITKENVAGLAKSTSIEVNTATASSYSEGHEAIYAIDGIDTPMSFWEGLDSCPQWLQLDFGSTKNFDNTRIHFYDYDQISYQYYIEVSNDGNSWTRIVDEKTGSGAVLDSFSEVNARFLKITVTSSSASSIARIMEVSVGGEPSGITASSYDGGHTPDLAVDGIDWTYWGTNAQIIEGQVPQWLQFDLRSPISISEIETYFFDGDSRVYTYKIEVSNSTSSWTEIVPPKTGVGLVLDSFPQITARYVRITVTANTANLAAHIEEVKILHVTRLDLPLEKIGVAASDLSGNTAVLVTNVSTP